MSVDVSVSLENVRIPLSRAAVTDAASRVLRAEKVSSAIVSITFVDDTRIARLNREHLGHRGPTDVISFGFEGATRNAPVTGDIYIGVDAARRNARDAVVSVREELLRLVTHGVLHVLGYDHPDGDERLTSAMWRRQERLLARLTSGAR